MSKNYQYKPDDLDKFQLSLYLLPVVGIIPSLLCLSSQESNLQQKKVSRTSVNLFFAWIFCYSFLWLGSSITSEVLSLRLLYLNGLLTTGYFLGCLIFTFALWQGKTINFPLKSFRKSTTMKNKNSQKNKII